MSPRNIINTLDTISHKLRDAIADSSAYIEEDIEEHYRRFPADRGSAFVRNIITKRVYDQDIYMSKLINNLLYLKSAFKKNPADMNPILNHISVAEEALHRMLKITKEGLGRTQWGLDLRYHNIYNALQEYESLKQFIERQKNAAPAPIKIPVGYTGWESIGSNTTPGGNMWRKSQGNYQLLVQESYGKFYATVKDIPAGRVYSNSTAFDKPEDAMRAATSTAVRLASKITPQLRESNPSETYRSKYSGNQGRLF